MSARLWKVRELVRAVNDALEPLAEDCSASEVLSAYMTLALNAVLTAKQMGVTPESLRLAVARLMIECDDGRKQ